MNGMDKVQLNANMGIDFEQMLWITIFFKRRITPFEKIDSWLYEKSNYILLPLHKNEQRRIDV